MRQRGASSSAAARQQRDSGGAGLHLRTVLCDLLLFFEHGFAGAVGRQHTGGGRAKVAQGEGLTVFAPQNILQLQVAVLHRRAE